MRIAFLTFEYPDVRPGGIGSYVLKSAASLAAAGHEAHIFTLSVPPKCREALPPGVFVHDVPDLAEQIAAGTLPGALGVTALNGELPIYKLTVGALLCHALRQEHAQKTFDVVEAAEYEALSLPLMFAPLEGHESVPIITQIHLGSGVNSQANAIPVGKTDQLADALEYAAILGADRVYAATRSIAEVTRRILPFEREMPIIPYPVAVTAEKTRGPRAGADGPILFVGRLQKRKGCDIFASAASLFLNKHPAARIRIAGGDTNTGPGGGSMQQEMVRRMDRSVCGRVAFCGELPQAEVIKEIQACRFQVIPSVVENFANTAIDAMAAGCAVIYAGGSGLDDVVGDAGMRVWPLTAENLAAQMDAAWSDPALVAAYAQKGRERVEKEFALERVTRRRVEFYEAAKREMSNADRQRIYDRLGPLNSVQTGCLLAALTALLAATAGLPSTLATPGRHVKLRLEEIQSQLGRRPVVWLFGAGRYTLRLLAERFLWESQGFSIAGIIDEHPRFAGMTHYLGLPLRSLKQMHAAFSEGEAADAVLLSTDTLQEVFWERTASIRERGVATIRIV